MTINPRVLFEIALQNLAKEHGFEMTEVPLIDGSGRSSGTAFAQVYDPESGSPTESFVAQFRPMKCRIGLVGVRQ